MCLSGDDSSSSPLFNSIPQNSYVNIMCFVLLSIIMSLSLCCFIIMNLLFVFLVEVNISLQVALVMLLDLY